MPCCWWSRGCSGYSRCCGWCYCSPRRPGQPLPPRAPACQGDLGAGVEVRAPGQGSPLPQRLRRVPQVGVVWGLFPEYSLWGRPGILTRVRVDVPERSGEQGPDEEGTKGDAQHCGQDEGFAWTSKGREALASCPFLAPSLSCWPGTRVWWIPVPTQPLTAFSKPWSLFWQMESSLPMLGTKL